MTLPGIGGMRLGKRGAWSRALGAALLSFLILLCGTVQAADGDNPLKPADTSSPRATLKTFIEDVTSAYQILEAAEFANMTEPGLFTTEAVEKRVEEAADHLARATRTLDLSEIPPTAVHDVGLETALLLKEVLDRIPLPPYSDIPDAQAVKQDDLIRWRVPNTDIVIAKVMEGPRAGEFLFSPDTVDRVDLFYAKVKHMPYQTAATKGFYESYITTPGKLLTPKWLHWLWDLPPWARTPINGQTLWQWIGLGLALLIGFFIPCLFYRWQSRREVPENLVWRAWRRLLLPGVIMLSLLLVRYLTDNVINITGHVYDITIHGLVALFYLTFAWLAVVVGTGVAETIISSPHIDPKSIDANMLRVLFRVLGAILAIVLVFFGAERLGIPILPLLAGLGVGGLALALAAQPTIENLIGGIMLYSDRPVRVGDLCQFGSLRGRVENIGLRSIRLRSIDRKVITVPNAEFAKMNLINYTQRDRMLIRTTIGLRYETTPEQLRFVLVKLREMLIGHPRINLVPMRVRFIGFGAYSLDVQIHCFANTRLFPEMAAIREDVYLRAIDIIKEAGTDFAFPSQTTYLARDRGLDDEQ
ncbi:MAG: mechanosensitive ion channel family protein, partial [Alphaproteobacteria bacterium]|nr:mechanosensitive ion channel family protein [Alphaproteobacteria bacterium]